MIQFTVEDGEVIDYLEATKVRILEGVRVGMREAMEGLAWTVVDKLGGDPIVSRSGRLFGAVLGSQKVTETDNYIKGTVSGMVDGKPLGLWLEEGVSVPAVAGALYHFTAADGASVFTHGHGAFKVAPKPFMNPALQQYAPTLIDIIATKIQGAVDATV